MQGKCKILDMFNSSKAVVYHNLLNYRNYNTRFYKGSNLYSLSLNMKFNIPKCQSRLTPLQMYVLLEVWLLIFSH